MTTTNPPKCSESTNEIYVDKVWKTAISRSNQHTLSYWACLQSGLPVDEPIQQLCRDGFQQVNDPANRGVVPPPPPCMKDNWAYMTGYERGQQFPPGVGQKRWF